MSLKRYAGATYDKEEILKMFSAILDGWWSGGRYTKEFQDDFAQFVGIKHALACNSGSSANLLAVSALELDKGSEVITPLCTFPTTLNPIIQCGLVPVFVDVDDTFNINTKILRQARSDKTRLIIIPHTLGNPCNMDDIVDICSEYDLRLIEDCCDALGAKYNNKYVSSFGDLATFSFYPAHHMTTGEGGMVVTNNSDLAKKVRSYRDWGRMCNCDPCLEMIQEGYVCSERLNFTVDGIPYDKRYAYSHIGYNLKMTEIQAAMGISQIQKLGEFIRKRNENYNTLLECLTDAEWLRFPVPNGEPSWFVFPMWITDGAPFSRDQVVKHLEEHGIQTRPIFAGNILKQPAYNNIQCRVVGDTSWSDRLFRNAFFVGVYPGLDKDDMQYIGEVLNDIDNGRTRFSRK